MEPKFVDNPKPYASNLAWLQLLHLADSALPIGAMAHSFGIETLTVEAGLAEADLFSFFADWLNGVGGLEAAFCLWAHSAKCEDGWTKLNRELTSFKVARESREASLQLGRRFLALASMLIKDPKISLRGDAHLATAFGLVSGALAVEPKQATAAYLHQTLFSAISACQRLLPFGQSAAMGLLWALKPKIVQAVDEAAKVRLENLWSLQPMLEIASMRHPQLATRLFIS